MDLIIHQTGGSLDELGCASPSPKRRDQGGTGGWRTIVLPRYTYPPINARLTAERTVFLPSFCTTSARGLRSISTTWSTPFGCPTPLPQTENGNVAVARVDDRRRRRYPGSDTDPRSPELLWISGWRSRVQPGRNTGHRRDRPSTPPVVAIADDGGNGCRHRDCCSRSGQGGTQLRWSAMHVRAGAAVRREDRPIPRGDAPGAAE